MSLIIKKYILYLLPHPALLREEEGVVLNEVEYEKDCGGWDGVKPPYLYNCLCHKCREWDKFMFLVFLIFHTSSWACTHPGLCMGTVLGASIVSGLTKFSFFVINNPAAKKFLSTSMDVGGSYCTCIFIKLMTNCCRFYSSCTAMTRL